MNAHQRLRQPAIQLFVPLRVAAQANGNVVGDDLKNPADGVAGLERGVHFGFHFFLRGGIHAAQRRIQIGSDRLNFLPGRASFQAHVPDLNGVAGDFRSKLAKEQLRKSSGGDASRGFPSGCPLKHVACIVKIKFL